MNKYAFFYIYLILLAALSLGAMALFRWWRKDSPVRLLAGNLTVFFLLLYAGFLVGEGYFYFFYDTTDASFAFLTSKRWIERHVRQNEMGFRGRMLEPESTRKPGEIRILVLGDSVAYGQGIKREEDRFSDLLEKKLRESAVDAKVYNVSRPGWNTEDERNNLDNLVHRLGIRFDLVILAYVMNDYFFEDDYSEGYMRAVLRMTYPPPAVEAVITRSLFLSFLYHRLVSFRDPFLNNYDRMAFELFFKPYMWKRQVAKLDMIRKICKDSSSRLVVVTFPLNFRSWDKYEFAPVHRTLDAYWKKAGILNIDLLEDFKKYPVEQLWVGKYDSHPNEQANRFTAERIYREVFEHRP